MSEFIWYASRISFWVMVGIWALEIVIAPTTPEGFIGGLFISCLWMVAIGFAFITSIIHLVKYKEKGFAITCLVISAIMGFFFMIGVMEGMAMAGAVA